MVLNFIRVCKTSRLTKVIKAFFLLTIGDFYFILFLQRAMQNVPPILTVTFTVTVVTVMTLTVVTVMTLKKILTSVSVTMVMNMTTRTKLVTVRPQKQPNLHKINPFMPSVP